MVIKKVNAEKQKKDNSHFASRPMTTATHNNNNTMPTAAADATSNNTVAAPTRTSVRRTSVRNSVVAAQRSNPSWSSLSSLRSNKNLPIYGLIVLIFVLGMYFAIRGLRGRRARVVGADDERPPGGGRKLQDYTPIDQHHDSVENPKAETSETPITEDEYQRLLERLRDDVIAADGNNNDQEDGENANDDIVAELSSAPLTEVDVDDHNNNDHDDDVGEEDEHDAEAMASTQQQLIQQQQQMLRNRRQRKNRCNSRREEN
jgi:hypothetical protein